MSINKTSKYEKIKNYCKHDEQMIKTKALNKFYFYCFKCNHIILIYNNKSYTIYKLIEKDDEEEYINDKLEFSPIDVVKLMIKRQDDQIKEINDKLVLNFSNNENLNKNDENNNNELRNETINESNNNEKKDEKAKELNNKNVDNEKLNMDKNKKNKLTKLIFDEENLDKYCEQRNNILVYIHKLCTKLEFNDNSFYMTLYLADTYLSKIFFSDDITEKELFLVILGFFLISSKYIQDDIFEPEFQTFCNLEQNIEALTIDEIRTSEVQCLTLINHNLYIYSVYDWLNILLNNGIIFEGEIEKINELEKINLYSQKILTVITSKIYFCRFTSMQIAFAIIQLSREKYINTKSELSENLYKLLLNMYDVDFSDYEDCYNLIKIDLSESNEMEEEEENEEMSDKENINNLNILEVNKNKANSKTLNKERNNFELEKISRKNKNRISVDSHKVKRYIKTDININLNKFIKNEHKQISSFDKKKDNLRIKKIKLKINGIDAMQNNSKETINNNFANKKFSPSILSQTNNTSLNNTGVKSYDFKYDNKTKNFLFNKNKKNDLILSEKNPKVNNTLFINYAPKFLIKNNGTIINNINYINNISITNDGTNLYTENNKKLRNNINSTLTNSNINYRTKSKNNKNSNEIINNNINNIIRKTLLNLDNIIPFQLNYEYNFNSINNNKIKRENNINKLQNIFTHNKNTKSNFKLNEKLKNQNKEKFKSHLLLDFTNNSNVNNLFKDKNNKISILANKEAKSLNKYTENNNNTHNKKMNNFKINKNEVRIMNTNINLNMNLNNNIKSKKITLNFKDVVEKKIKSEHINKFLIKNNIDNKKRFKSLHNNNFYNKESKNEEKKYAIFNNSLGKNNNLEGNITNKDNSKNIIINTNSNEIGRNHMNNINNYKNMASFKQKLPKLRLNKNSILTNKSNK